MADRRSSTPGAGVYLERLIAAGWIDVLFAGNALATHDIESALLGTSLGVQLTTGVPTASGHNHHLRAINTIRAAGGIREAVAQGVLTRGVMHACVTHGVDYVLAGSIRDDGPLPDVITDVVRAQDAMRLRIPAVGLAIMVATTLHSVATGNLLPVVGADHLRRQQHGDDHQADGPRHAAGVRARDGLPVLSEGTGSQAGGGELEPMRTVQAAGCSAGCSGAVRGPAGPVHHSPARQSPTDSARRHSDAESQTGGGVISGAGVGPGSGRPLPVRRLMARTVMSWSHRIWQDRRTPVSPRSWSFVTSASVFCAGSPR